jgi:hypothetical protein
MMSTLQPGINTTNCPITLLIKVLPNRRLSAAQIKRYRGLLTALMSAIWGQFKLSKTLVLFWVNSFKYASMGSLINRFSGVNSVIE